MVVGRGDTSDGGKTREKRWKEMKVRMVKSYCLLNP